MKKTKFLSLLSPLLLLFGQEAPAATSFTYSGNCLVACAAFGLPNGGSVFGNLEFLPGTDVPGAGVGQGKIQSFSFTFGNVQISSATHIILPFNVNFNAAGTDLVGAGGSLQFRRSSNLAFEGAIQTGAGDAFSNVSTPPYTFVMSGTGSLVSAVPEPAEWALLTSGLCLVGFAARRKRAAAA